MIRTRTVAVGDIWVDALDGSGVVVAMAEVEVNDWPQPRHVVKALVWHPHSDVCETPHFHEYVVREYENPGEKPKVEKP